MFIVLKLHRESLRQMMNQGRVNRSIKIQVLEMLKKIVCGGNADHGDIKDLLIFHQSKSIRSLHFVKTEQTARKYFGRLRLQRRFRLKLQMLFGWLGHSGWVSWRDSNVRRSENIRTVWQRFILVWPTGTGIFSEARRKVSTLTNFQNSKRVGHNQKNGFG